MQLVFTMSPSRMAKREVVVKLIQDGKKNHEIIKEVKGIGVKEKFVRNTRNRFHETGGITNRPRSGAQGL